MINPSISDLAAQFQRDRFGQLEALLERGNTRGIRQLAMAVRAEYVPVHDGFRDAVALTLGWLARTYGPETGEQVGRMCVEKLMAAGDPPQYSQAGLRDRVKAIAFGWHWHVTRLTVTEDDDKITFLLHPCGSGMRLIQEGYYAPGKFGPPGAGSENGPLTRSKWATWANFMSEEFPIYCNHCSEMGHMALLNSAATFLVEGWTPLRAKGICIQHTYKDVALVPDEFYRRADLPLPERRERPEVPARLFAPEELIDLQTHPLDKLIDRAERGDLIGARAALDECLSGWRDSIHDVYRNWASKLWLEIYQQLGPGAYAAVIRAIGPDLFRHIRGAEVFGWAAFWSIHLRLRSIAESADACEFTVGQESLLQPGDMPYEPGWFVARLHEGLAERGWSEIGQFSVSGENFVHRLPKA